MSGRFGEKRRDHDHTGSLPKQKKKTRSAPPASVFKQEREINEWPEKTDGRGGERDKGAPALFYCQTSLMGRNVRGRVR